MFVQEGENVYNGSRGNKFKYPYKPSEKFKRTEKLYAEQVHNSQTLQTTVNVIKGATYMSNWLTLPTYCIIEIDNDTYLSYCVDNEEHD